MKIFIKLIIFFFFFTNILYADLINPSSKLNPYEVLMIQLNSLKNNNNPYEDAGIEQTWKFAHPTNKAATGPLNKFKEMIYSDNYKILIDHENTQIINIKETNNKFIFKVYVLSKDKKKYYYVWQIEKVLVEGDFKNCWMTTSVSNPEFLGDVI